MSEKGKEQAPQHTFAMGSISLSEGLIDGCL